MYHYDEAATRSGLGRIAICCPMCKSVCYGPHGVEENGKPILLWYCVHCNAKFSSNPPYTDSGISKEEFKEKIIQLLLEDGKCEQVVKIFATSSKKPPIFIEENLRELLSNL